MLEAKTETGKDLTDYVKKHYDFRPLEIIKKLKLRNPIYFQTAAYGHFGKAGLPWEKIEA
jgi:S-adenosylmethionine synthetase